MKTSFLTLILTLNLVYSSFGQRKTWVIDQAHTSITFSVVHMGIAEIVGTFQSFGGNVTASKEDFTDAFINFYINTKSLDTENNMRDMELISSAFLASARYPTILFESEKFVKLSANHYVIEGILTVRDVDKPVKFEVDFGGMVTDASGAVRAGFKLKGKINRFDYGISWNEMLEKQIPIVASEIIFVVNLQLVRSD